MAEKLGEIGKFLANISDAVKTAKSMQQLNGRMYRIIEETKEQAVKLDELKIPDEPLLQDLKEAVKNVHDSGTQLETWIQKFVKGTDLFDRSVRTKIDRNTIPPEVIAEFCEDLNTMYRMSKDFTKVFETFANHLSKAQELATNLAAKLKQKERDLQKQADSRRNEGAAGTVGLALAGAGLVALGFFTGGAAWVAAGAVAGAACGAGAVAVGMTTASSVREMRELASDILKDANKMEIIAKNLKSSSDRAGEIKLDKEAMKSLKAALQFFRRDQEKDARIAELEAELRSLRH